MFMVKLHCIIFFGFYNILTVVFFFKFSVTVVLIWRKLIQLGFFPESVDVS